MSPISYEPIKRFLLILFQEDVPILKTERSLQCYLFILSLLYYKRYKKPLWDAKSRMNRWFYKRTRPECPEIKRILSEDPDFVVDPSHSRYTVYKLRKPFFRIKPDVEVKCIIDSINRAIFLQDWADVSEAVFLRYGIFGYSENEEIDIKKLIR